MADKWLMLTILFAMLLGGVFLLLLHRRSLGWRGTSKSGARLPNGSFGWPLLGESIAFLQDPPKFASSRVKRYGEIFKSSFMLQRGIVGTTPEFAKFVTSSTNLFVGGWPETLVEMVGPKSFMFRDGPQHMSIRKLVQKPLLPEALRLQVNVLEAIILENMASWEQRGTVIGCEGTQMITRDTGMWLITGLRDIGCTPEGKQVQESFERMFKGVLSIPLNLPGTAYNKGLKARAVLTQYMKDLIEKRKGQDKTTADVLGVLLASQEDPQAPEEVKNLDENMMADNLVSIWFAAFDAPAITLNWVLKFLAENPKVFRRIQEEQREILKSKDPSVEGPRLSWEDTRKMVYTQKFFHELQRILSIAPYIARQATQDVEYEGLLIPKGWVVRPLFSLIHQDPAIYPNPKSFDPDRFDAPPKPYTYIPFSVGAHMCPGIEFAKLLVLIFIHYLATTYIHESVAPDKGTEYIFFPRIRGGYPITFHRRN